MAIKRLRQRTSAAKRLIHWILCRFKNILLALTHYLRLHLMVIYLNMSIQMSSHENPWVCVKQVLISSLIADIESQTKCAQLLQLLLQLSLWQVNDLIRKNWQQTPQCPCGVGGCRRRRRCTPHVGVPPGVCVMLAMTNNSQSFASYANDVSDGHQFGHFFTCTLHNNWTTEQQNVNGKPQLFSWSACAAF